MKIDHIHKKHIEEAASYIADFGVPYKYIENQYWVVVNGKEFPFKYLIQIAHQVATGNKEWLEKFQSQPNYRKYIENLGFPINYYKDWINFFTADELEYFHSVKGKSFKSGSDEAEILKDKFSSLLFKTERWTQKLLPEDYSYNFTYRWQYSGVVDYYFWSRIFKKEWQTKGIFFTIGVTGEAKGLFYKLDCQFKGTQRSKALTDFQQEKFRKLLELYDCKEHVIGIEELKKLNWDSLISLTRSYIEDFLELYEEVVAHVWNLDKVKKEEPKNTLTLQNPPKKTLAAKKTNQRSNQNPDWELLNKHKKRIGDAGENLVMEVEKKKLRDAGREDLQKEVYKVPDSFGYDVHSVCVDESEILIEVKTTPLIKETPFYLTKNEIQTSESNSAKYILYRVFNYDSINNSGDYYFLKGNLRKRLTLEPINYKASINSKSIT